MATFEKGRVVAERFRLEEELGVGGMGSVWRAHHLTLDIPCALKFIRDDKVSDRTMTRFRHEARSAAKLRSPNVVQMLDYGIWEGSHYIAMELMEGETLRERLEREKRLSTGKTFNIIRDVARALSRAGELSIVHRDLKPDNLFIVQDGDREIVKVLDFGVAKVPVTDVAQQQTRTGALVGTPYYMSPEQAQGDRAIDARSDLWSLAVITFACVTGRLPFQSTGLGSLLKEIMLAPMPVPSEVAPDLPAEFDRWWAKATQRDPEERFQSADELIKGLELALMGKLNTDTTVPDGTKGPDGTEQRVSHAASVISGEVAAPTLPYQESTHAPLSTSSAVAPPPLKSSSAATRVAAGLALLVLVGGAGLYASGVFSADTSSDVAPASSTPTASAVTSEAPQAETKQAETKSAPPETAAPATTASASAVAKVAAPKPRVEPRAKPRIQPRVWPAPPPKAKPKPPPDQGGAGLRPGY